MGALFIYSAQALNAQRGTDACRTFRMCHNSKGVAYSSVEVFQALEPLFEELQLSPLTDYVDIVQLPGRCTSTGCCCSTPLEVTIRLPADIPLSNKWWDDVVAEYVADTMEILVPGAVCVGDVEVSECIDVELEEELPRMHELRPFASRRLFTEEIVPEAVPTTLAASHAEYQVSHGSEGGYGYYYGGYYGSR